MSSLLPPHFVDAIQSTVGPDPADVAIRLLAGLLGLFLVTYPAGRFIRWTMRSKTEQIAKSNGSGDGELSTKRSRGFDDGGALIGRLERALIYLFVLSGETSAVGFLIAAKSVFRFGELSQQEQRLEAEYITIGTLWSFAIGLAIAMAFRRLVGGV